jgi:hypothetical protein
MKRDVERTRDEEVQRQDEGVVVGTRSNREARWRRSVSGSAVDDDTEEGDI